jgi:hypothetical protein
MGRPPRTKNQFMDVTNLPTVSAMERSPALSMIASNKADDRERS